MFLHIAIAHFCHYCTVLHLYFLFHYIVGRHLGCFYFGDTNNAEVNIFIPVFFFVHIILAFFGGIHLRENLLSEPNSFPKGLYQLMLLPSIGTIGTASESSNCSPASLAIVSFPNYSHFGGWLTFSF